MLSVAMQARKQIAYAEICENHQQKSENRKIRGASARPAAGNPRVEKSGVSQPRDQCAGFL